MAKIKSILHGDKEHHERMKTIKKADKERKAFKKAAKEAGIKEKKSTPSKFEYSNENAAKFSERARAYKHMREHAK